MPENTRARPDAAGDDVVATIRATQEWMAVAMAGLRSRDAEIDRLRAVLQRIADGALLGTNSAAVARAALAPPPASDATPPPGWPTLENVR